MTIEIPLTKEKFAIVDDCDAHLIGWKWSYHSMGYGVRGVYLNRRKEGEKHLMIFIHHAIMGRPINGMFIDHINGNRLDNRRENLRIVSRRENSQNTKRHRGESPKSSKFLGVDVAIRNYPRGIRKYFRASIVIDGKKKHIGYFKNEEDASNAYQHTLKNLEVS